jgi:hypothetical protein
MHYGTTEVDLTALVDTVLDVSAGLAKPIDS